MGATSAFAKLYFCTFMPDGSHFSCVSFAPGMHATFMFEFYIFMVRTSLVWLTGLMLWKHDDVLKMKRKYDQVSYCGHALLRACPPP